jgi:four helix bundle protein
MQEAPAGRKKYKYDLQERTTVFAENVIDFCKTVKETAISKPLISQLVRAGTSVGANYCEANGASSQKDFRNKIFICKKEIQETKYWLRLIKKVTFESSIQMLSTLSQECYELVLIFQKITSTLNQKSLKIVN